MVAFTVYEPPDAPSDPVDRAERLAFVKDGFHWLAALFPAPWMLVKGLWLELIVFLGVVAALTWGVEALSLTSAAAGMLLLVVQILFGFEAGALHGAALERRGWRLVGTIAGRNREECEYRFLQTWLASPPGSDGRAAAQATESTRLPSWPEVAWRNVKDALARRHGSGAEA